MGIIVPFCLCLTTFLGTIAFLVFLWSELTEGNPGTLISLCLILLILLVCTGIVTIISNDN
jgi:hypothetical protein